MSVNPPAEAAAATSADEAAVRRLAAWFREPAVGVACGRLDLVDPRTGKNVDGLYWKYEKWMRRNESRVWSTLGATGAIYALRRRCFSTHDTVAP